MSVSAGDRRAAFILLLVGVAGLLARLIASPGAPIGAVAYQSGAEGERPSKDSVKAQAGRLARPLERGERIDIDAATILDLTRLPRIGPGLAARIVADREDRGPFGSIEQLSRVSGVGPAVIEAVRAHASFSRRARAPAPVPAGAARIRVNQASEAELATLPGIGPARARAIVQHREQHGPFRTLDDLDQVTGIGPSTLKRIAPHVVVP